MISKKIEGVMVTIGATPIIVSLIYNIENIEKVMRSISTILNPFGVAATLVALFLLWRSLREQRDHHDEQIYYMNDLVMQMENQHAEQIRQLRQQLLRMEKIDRERTLREYIIALSNNAYSYRENYFDKGAYFISYSITDRQSKEVVRYVCLIFWRINYRSEKRDKNYIFDLRFAIFQISTSLETSFYAKGIEESHVEELEEIIINNSKNSNLWNYKFSLPRFENGYGQVSNDKSSFTIDKLKISETENNEFHTMIYAMSIIQSFDTDMIEKCNNIANRFSGKEQLLSAFQ